MTAAAPWLSLVVVSYQMSRELPRTLHTLSPKYQQGIAADQYEVIVVDNGSTTPPESAQFADLGLDLQVHRCPDPGPSPVRAINLGLSLARAPLVGVMIDGARMVSPGLLEACQLAARLDSRAVITVPSFHFGPGPQWLSMLHGYDQAQEDRLLEAVDWHTDGYRLFDIAPAIENGTQGWFGPLGESNALFMHRDLWTELGGYDAAFASPGGGSANVDTLLRALGLPGTKQVVILGEATFHQFHGGVATNAGNDLPDYLKRAAGEYYRVRGKPMKKHFDPSRIYVGPVSRRAAEVYQQQLSAGRAWKPMGKPATADPAETAGRYLALLKAALLNELGSAAAIDALRASGQITGTSFTPYETHLLGYTMITRQRLDHLHQCVNTVLDEGIPGDFMECGVWRGGACMLIKAILDVRGVRDRRVWLADSFAGLPPPRGAEDEGLDLSAAKHPELAVSVDQVKRAFDAFGLLDERVAFVPGWFADTLQNCTVQQLAVLRIDCDLHSSTLEVLDALYDRVAPGGFVIVDDYGILPQCARAVDTFRVARRIEAPLCMIDWTGAFWRKA